TSADRDRSFVEQNPSESPLRRGFGISGSHPRRRIQKPKAATEPDRKRKPLRTCIFRLPPIAAAAGRDRASRDPDTRKRSRRTQGRPRQTASRNPRLRQTTVTPHHRTNRAPPVNDRTDRSSSPFPATPAFASGRCEP